MKLSGEAIVIFDLDGTLVDSDDFDAKFYVEAVREVIGDIEIDESWTRYRHVTDAGTLGQIVEEGALREPVEIAMQVRDLFGSKVRKYLDRGGTCDAVPGAVACLNTLRAEGHKIGIATGGWGHTARMKLQQVGISSEGLAMATSDDSADRVQIMTTCLSRLSGDSGKAVYVGDGLWDLEASEKVGWTFVGVGEKLRGHCGNWIADFRDGPWR